METHKPRGGTRLWEKPTPGNRHHSSNSQEKAQSVSKSVPDIDGRGKKIMSRRPAFKLSRQPLGSIPSRSISSTKAPFRVRKNVEHCADSQGFRVYQAKREKNKTATKVGRLAAKGT